MQGDKAPEFKEKENEPTGELSQEPGNGHDSSAAGGGDLFDSTAPSLHSMNDEEFLSKRAMERSLTGEIIDNQFKMLEILGKGGMSVVYKALHMVLNRTVAIKLMHPHLVSDTQALLRFKQEAQAASQIDHASVIKVYSFGVTGGENSQPYIVMDYLEGESLADLIKKQKRLPVPVVLKIFIQTTNALAHAHAKGIIHRDLKPSNIMLLEKDGDPYFVKLVDFGIAKLVSQEGESAHRLTQTGDIFGSPTYMSPEQCRGSVVDKRSDIYALGCVLYECLSGRPPHQGQNVFETFHKHISEIPDPLDMPGEDRALVDRLDAVVFRALEKEPEKRYQSMSDFENDLRSIQADLGSGGRGTNLRLRVARQQRDLQRFAKTAPKLAILAAFSFLLLAGAGAFLWSKSTWFFASHKFEPAPTRWGDFRGRRYPKSNLPVGRRESILTEKRKALLFMETVTSIGNYNKLMDAWADFAKTCAEYDSPGNEIEACNKTLQNMHELGLDGDTRFADMSGQLGDCYLSQGELKEAAVQFQRAEQIKERWTLKDPLGYLNLGYVLNRLGDYRNSSIQLNCAIDTYKEEGTDNRRMAIAYAILGDDYLGFAQSDIAVGIKEAPNLMRADENYAEAQKLMESSSYKGKDLFLSELSLCRAYVNLRLGKYKEACGYYAKAMPYVDHHFDKQPDLRKAILDAYSFANWMSGNFSLAFQLREKASSLLADKPQ